MSACPGTSHADDIRLRSYSRQADHTPNTADPESEVYILALRTDTAHHERMTALRKQYFPINLNKLDAHVALFRALPGSQLTTISADINDLAKSQTPFTITATKPYQLGHGVAIHVHAPEAGDIFKKLRGRWAGFLSKQDQSFQPHYTIQNKVEKEVAERTLQEVRETFHGSDGQVGGLSLYRYDKGFWRHRRDFEFATYRIDDHDFPGLPTNSSGS